MNVKQSFAGPALLGPMLTYTGCVPNMQCVADCSDLAGMYHASDFGFTSVDGCLTESFDEGAFEVGFGVGLCDSSFSAPGYDPVTDAPYTAEAGTLTFSEPLFIDNVEPGAQTLTCEVVDEDTFTLRGDVGSDFGDDGVYEDAVFEGTFDRL